MAPYQSAPRYCSLAFHGHLGSPSMLVAPYWHYHLAAPPQFSPRRAYFLLLEGALLLPPVSFCLLAPICTAPLLPIHISQHLYPWSCSSQILFAPFSTSFSLCCSIFLLCSLSSSSSLSSNNRDNDKDIETMTRSTITPRSRTTRLKIFENCEFKSV